MFRAGPDGSPCPPPSHGPALHTPGQKWGQRDPRDPYAGGLAGTHRARQIGLRFVRDCHEGCSRLQAQLTLSAIAPHHRHPLTQDPRCRVPAAFIANVLLPPAQHTRTFGGPLLKIMSCCAQWPLRAWHDSLLAAGCPDPAPPPVRAVLAPVAPASFTPAPNSADLIS